ncbi:hypothetical protein IV01_13710 [Pseudomonas syringae]|uniref:Uncharacterized protein n=1 Tax=Pseudomonas syringae TaxID=317 RepID=A0A085VI58_PSESX|nr:hypothetical protein IV01_13710 [Pseudomonas syringae]
MNKQAGCQAAALLIWLLILGAPLNHAGRTQALNRGQPGRTPGCSARAMNSFFRLMASLVFQGMMASRRSGFARKC